MMMTKRLLLAPAFAAVIALTACSAPTVEAPKAPVETQETAPEETPKEAKEGTRGNPAPLGSTITDGDWSVTINSVNLNASDVIAVNEYNDPPAEGHVYILVNGTIAYNGETDEGELNFSDVSYVTSDGKTISQSYQDTSGSGEDDFSTMDPIYPGTTHTGVVVFEVPAAVDGALVISADMGSKRKFVAIK